MSVFSLCAAYAFDAAESVILWATVAVLAAVIVAGVSVYFAKRAVFPAYLKYSVLGFTAYALVSGIIMLVLQLVKRTDPEYLQDKWLNADVTGFVIIPLLAAFCAALFCGIAMFVVYNKKRSLFKPTAIASAAVVGAGVIAAAVTIGIYYSKHIANDGYYSEYANPLALYIAAGGLAAALVTTALTLGIKDKTPFDSRAIALAGVCVSMSFALSYVKIFDLPFGGSVTLVSLFPVSLYAYVYGTKKGLLIGFVYGLMQAMQDPYIIHPAQFLLDYPIAFASVALAGAFSKFNALKFHQIRFALGAVLVGAFRFTAHVLSGVFAFGADALGSGFENFWLYSATYNSYVFVDIALVVAAGVLVLSSKSFVKQLESYAVKKTANTAETV